MLLNVPLLCASLLALAAHAQPETQSDHTSTDFLGTCQEIATNISNASQVFFPPAPQYTSDISHAILSSIQNSTCSVEPGSAEDVSKILKILGACRTPFAVKGGGHTSNPGFSSTPGVQISMSRLNEIIVSADNGTIEVGPGLTWDQVYQTLSPTGVNVIGGRVPGVGVGGLTLGGGYSYKSSQYGLALDNVAGYELVLPNGTIKHVTSEDEDLWFGLRGGLNNFGIVTKFILKSHPQTDIWGGILVFTGDKQDQIRDAFVKFQQNNDDKAAMMLIVSYPGQLVFAGLFFYDAPTPPAGIFDDFSAIQRVQGNLSTISFSDFVLGVNSFGVFTRSIRNFYHGAPVTQYSPAVFDAVVNFTVFWGKDLAALDNTVLPIASLEPFGSGLFSHGSPSAYPPDRDHAIFPTALIVQWSDPSLDEKIADVLRESAEMIRNVALADGQNVSDAAVYVNNALFGTPLENIYGRNVPRLQEIKASIDPERVMDLAGGFKF